MRIKKIAIAMVIILVAGVTTLTAKNLRYLGKAAGDGTRGRVHHEGKSYTVREGDEITGWGKVKSVTDEHLVIERALTADEKRDREAKGLAAPDVQDVYVANAMRTLACSRDCAPEQ